eukprot:TRINITY_DN5060_c0_g1_i1.p1 TRINITY_DN5060_c0_g1~~TRINITY_DN5060_c0_g1_i1.p1  ORF type:complete len:499 (-),score=116.93 TRINITY_DN5060_c0_g1_i1:490-1986(-)
MSTFTSGPSSPAHGDGGNPPSKVLHVRNVAPDTSNDEILGFVGQFGVVQGITFLARYNQALIEMDSVQSASAVVAYNRTTPVYMRNREIRFSFSKSQSINPQQLQGVSHGHGRNPTGAPHPSGGHNILLCTIYNPLFNITVDVLYAIMSPYGNVQRIVIFNKNGVQALVEFDNPTSAFQAKEALDAKDIYSGSCTLKIEYSKAEKLNVHTNTDKTRDYTNPSLPTAPSSHSSSIMTGYAATTLPDYYRHQSPGPLGSVYGSDMASRSVLIVYGLDETQMTPDRLFNLFCLYGNVSKIKFLSNKKGTALVQMGDNMQADFALQHLNNAQLFGHQLQVHYSKHPYIAESRGPADGESSETQATKDFSTTPLNRFTRAHPNAFKHIYKPTSTLYFSNLSKEYTEQQLITLFTTMGAPQPIGVKFFSLTPNPEQQAQGKEERRIGLIEFNDPMSTAEALAIVNNIKLNGAILRLSFSTNTINQHNSQTEGKSGASSSTTIST